MVLRLNKEMLPFTLTVHLVYVFTTVLAPSERVGPQFSILIGSL